MKKSTDKVLGSLLYSDEYVNVSKSERVVSVAFGAFMFWKGVKDVFSKPSNAVWELVLGGALIYRGATGYCAVKDRMENYSCSTDQFIEDTTEHIVHTM